jgi:hypothetical protein
MTDPLNPRTSFLTETTLSSGVQWAQSNSPSLKKTRMGLSLVFFGTITSMILSLIALLCFQLMGSKIFNESGAKVIVTILGTSLAVVANIIGPFLCLSVPAESGSKKFLVASIVLHLIMIVNTIVQAISPMALPLIVFYFTRLCGIISLFIFIYFLKKLSEYVGRDDLSVLGKKVLIGFFSVPAGIIAAFLLFFVVHPFFAVMASMGLFIFIICIFVMYINLIYSVRKSLVKENKVVKA